MDLLNLMEFREPVSIQAENSSEAPSFNDTSIDVSFSEYTFLWILLGCCSISVVFICFLIYLMTRLECFFSQKYNVLVFSMTVSDILILFSFCVFCVVRLKILNEGSWKNLCGITMITITIFGINTEICVLFIAIVRYIATYTVVYPCASKIFSPKFAITVSIVVAINFTIIMTRLGIMDYKQCSLFVLVPEDDYKSILNTTIGAVVCSIQILSITFSIVTILRLIMSKKKVQCSSVTTVQGTVKLKKNIILLSLTLIALISILIPRLFWLIKHHESTLYQLFVIRPIVNPFLYILSIKEMQQRLKEIRMCKCNRDHTFDNSHLTNIQ